MHSTNVSPLWRTVVRWDAYLALALGSTGVLTAPLQAEWTALPPSLHLGASLLLLLYSGAASLAARRAAPGRALLVGLVAFNVLWASIALGLAVGDAVTPSALGLALLASHVVLPGGVAAVVWLGALAPARSLARA